jgi:DNA-binding transcriptional MerR regulator
MPRKPITQTSPYELISARGVADRYGISLRSVDRWLARKVIPPASRIINTRRYWRLADLEAFDRASTVNAAAE